MTQAAIYGQIIREAACDPDVGSLSFFGFRDDGLRTGFQAGLERADGSARPALAAVELAAAESSACAGERRVWAPGIDVVGASVAVGGKGAEVTARVAAGEDARAKVCVQSMSAELGVPHRCRSVAVRGLRSLDVAVRAPRWDDGAGRGGGEVRGGVQPLAADARRARGGAQALT